MPDGKVREGNIRVEETEYIEIVERTKSKMVMKLLSGKYAFEIVFLEK